jgi:hypothetical protein
LPYEITQYDHPENFYRIVEVYYMCDDKESARKYAKIAMAASKAQLDYFNDLSSSRGDNAYFREVAIRSLVHLAQLSGSYGDSELATEAWKASGQTPPPPQQPSQPVVPPAI